MSVKLLILNMQLPKSFTTVTPVSKAIAILLFISLPFIGFYLGINYQKSITIYPTTIAPIQKYPKVTIIPTIVLTPSDTTAEPTKLISKQLNYFLPKSWQTIQDSTNSFEIGYDPTIFTSRASKESIFLGYIANQGSNSVTLIDYDGGSLHQVIYKQMGYDARAVAIEKSKSYFEKEYSYNGGRCLVLYGLNFSASGNVWGFCNVNSSKGLYFSGFDNSEKTEQLIQTFRYLAR